MRGWKPWSVPVLSNPVHCHLVNGLLLIFLIFPDPGKAPGSSSSPRSQIRALPPLFIVDFFNFPRSRHDHWIIVLVPAFSDLAITARRMVYCCMVFILSDPDTASGSSSLFLFSDPGIVTQRMVDCCIFYFLGSRHSHWIIGFVPAFSNPGIAARQMVDWGSSIRTDLDSMQYNTAEQCASIVPQRKIKTNRTDW